MQRPTGVTVIGVLGIIGAVFCALAGLLLLLAGSLIVGAARAGGGGMTGLFAALGAAAAIVFFGFAAIYVIAAVGLFKLRNWARIMTIVLCAISAAFSALGLVQMMSHIVISGLFVQLVVLALDIWIIWYLLQASVKQAFAAA